MAFEISNVNESYHQPSYRLRWQLYAG